MNNAPKCYLCENSECEKLDVKVRDNSELEVFRCNKCQLVFLSSFDHIKDGFYESDGMHNGIVDVENWLKQTKDDDVRRYKFLKKQIKGKNVLDFGCGNGGFLSLAKKNAQNAVGIELQQSLKDFYVKQGLEVFTDIEEMSEKVSENFDFITMFHVLEHIKDPISFLKKLGTKLNDNGEIIIEVPNSDDALLTLYKNQAFINFTYWSCHLFFFNESSFLEAVKQAGFKVNYLKHVQRYPFVNHLWWQVFKKPGGHKKLWFLNFSFVNKLYENSLINMKATDTIVVSISKSE